MRAIVQVNAKLKKYIHVHKREVSIEKITFSPLELSNMNQEADFMYAMLDVNKVLLCFYSYISLFSVLIVNYQDKQISKDEFINTANANPVLKKKLCDLLLWDENVQVLSPPVKRK